MRRIILVFILTNVLSFKAFSEDYYFYEGRRIDLIKRLDKVAIILNETNYNKFQIEQSLKSLLNLQGELKEITESMYLINLSTPVLETELTQQINSFQTNEELIKFATVVYYGESRKVTQIPTDEFIVRLSDLNTKKSLDALNKEYRVEIVDNINDENTFVLKSQNGVRLNALQFSEIYRQTGLFEYCEPNFGYPEACIFNYTPNDPLYTSQWTLNNIGQSTPTEGNTSAGDLTNSSGIPDADMDVNLAWDYVKGNNSVIIGIFDTGVDSAHLDLYQNLIAGYNATDGTGSVTSDPVGHGTCVTGIIGARTNNGLGVSGIVGGDNTLNSNCRIRAFRLVNNEGNFTTDVNIANAFNLARTTGVHVSSNSWGGGTPSTTLTNAINNLSNNGRGGLGCVVLFASGNDGRNPPFYPSYLASVVCVGASTKHDQKKAAGTGNQWWWGGNYGEDANGDLDLVAPTICYTTDIRGTGGYNTASGTAGDYYATFNGTSAACPNAAGVTALIFSINPNFTRNQVLDYLYRGCEKIDNANYNTLKTYGYWNEYYGYGRVNALNSVRLAMGVDVTPPTIVHNNISSHSSTYPTILTATIVDQNGDAVPNSGLQRPRIFYRFNKNGAGWSSFVSSFAISNNGNIFTFKIPGVGRQTEIQYYIEAQDAAGNITTFPKNVSTSFPFTLCYYAVGNIITETRGLVNWSPPDNGGGISPSINFPTAFSILEARVRINLIHTWVSDNILYVWSPISDADNNRKCLFSMNGGSGDNITNATVTDSATQFWRQSSPPYTNGHFKPEYLLTGLKGTNAFGNWRFVNLDVAAGDAPTYNSLDIVLKKMNGITSPCARLNNPADSILYFGNPSPPAVVDRNFYLKNDGNTNLTISSVSFSGTYASMFSLVTTLPGSIPPNDSALFTVRLNYNTLLKGNETLNTDAFSNAIMEISNNDPSKPIFRVSLETEFPLPVELSLFTAKVLRSGGVQLNWRTEIEVNNYGFEVFRSAKNDIEWSALGFIEGHGNSNAPKDYSFVDNSINYGKYSYRLKQIDTDGQFEYSKVIEVDAGNIPSEIVLEQNYPNPFNPTTTIKFALAETQIASLIIYDALGNTIETPFYGIVEGGKKYEVEFNAEGLSSGIYFYQLATERKVENRKMLLIK